MAITARSLAMGTLAMSHPWHVLVTLSLATSFVPSPARADVFPREFRPGPHVPEGFEPKGGIDASGLDLSGSTFIGMDLSGARFEGCDLRNTVFLQVVNQDGPASFRGADLRKAVFSESDLHAASDFTGALINGAMWAHQSRFLSIEQVRSTRSYQLEDLSECCLAGGQTPLSREAVYPKVSLDLRGFNLRGALFTRGDFTECSFAGADMREVKFVAAAIKQRQLHSQGGPRFGYTTRDGDPFDWLRGPLYEGVVFHSMDLSGWDFSGHSLRGAVFCDVRLTGARFNNCDIRNASFIRCITPEQLRSTKSYKQGNLTGLRLVQLNKAGLRFDGFDFSRRILAGGHLTIDGAGVDLSDAVITDADLTRCTSLTADQIKSTWNYKHGRMEGIVLPKDLANALVRQ